MGWCLVLYARHVSHLLGADLASGRIGDNGSKTMDLGPYENVPTAGNDILANSSIYPRPLSPSFECLQIALNSDKRLKHANLAANHLALWLAS